MQMKGTLVNGRIEVVGTMVNGRIEVVGTLPVTFSDFGIETPNVGGFVSVQDHGTMEFKLFFAKA